jgi:DNA-directed RNA polymerase subunit RPC12/RpoP
MPVKLIPVVCAWCIPGTHEDKILEATTEVNCENCEHRTKNHTQ